MQQLVQVSCFGTSGWPALLLGEAWLPYAEFRQQGFELVSIGFDRHPSAAGLLHHRVFSLRLLPEAIQTVGTTAIRPARL